MDGSGQTLRKVNAGENKNTARGLRRNPWVEKVKILVIVTAQKQTQVQRKFDYVSKQR